MPAEAEGESGEGLEEEEEEEEEEEGGTSGAGSDPPPALGCLDGKGEDRDIPPRYIPPTRLLGDLPVAWERAATK